MKEILELVHFEIMRSGYERKLIGGIVLTGGGAQLKHIKQLVEYITGLDCRIGKPIEHVINYSDESQLPPALSTGVGLVITGEENVGEDYFERELADPIVQQVETPEVEESPKFEETPIDAASAEDFMSFMTSIGVAGSDDDLHEEKSSFQNTIEEEEQTITDIVEEETVKPVTRSRKGRNPLESFLGRFKGFFENDEAVN
jgi:cell division ATPase FtsA